MKVLYRLKDAGFEAHIVGGGVRDLVLGLAPKDFDVATNATPEEVKSLFRNCRLIGRRFRLAHIHFGRDYIEVATFRAGGEDSHPARKLEDGRLIFDNVYGSIEEDAVRRDFTVNSLYYSIADFSIRDYCSGWQDLKDGLIRLIGDPEARYREDPVRLLRAVRFAARLHFRIEPATEAPLRSMGPSLDDIPPARLFEEMLKLFMTGHAEASFNLLLRYDLLRCLFPQTAGVLDDDAEAPTLRMLRSAMQNTDERVAHGKPVTPAFLFGALLWPPFYRRRRELEDKGMSPHDASLVAANEVIGRQVKRVAIPKRFSVPMSEIWQMQTRFYQQKGKRLKRLLAHPRFRAAYDFLLLRSVEDPELKGLADWWTEIQESPESGSEVVQHPGRKRRGKGRGPRRRSRSKGSGPQTV